MAAPRVHLRTDDGSVAMAALGPRPRDVSCHSRPLPSPGADGTALAGRGEILHVDRIQVLKDGTLRAGTHDRRQRFDQKLFEPGTGLFEANNHAFLGRREFNDVSSSLVAMIVQRVEHLPSESGWVSADQGVNPHRTSLQDGIVEGFEIPCILVG